MDTPHQIAEAIKEHEARMHKRSKRFVPPTAEQAMEYAYSLGYRSFDAQGFVDFYESKGWKVGNQKMRSWKAAVRTWKRRENIVEERDDGLCVVDKQPGAEFRSTVAGKKIWLCTECRKAWGKQGNWAIWSYGVIETRVLAAKARR